jgi:hypothetical protein
MLLSLIIHTASCDNFLACHGLDSYFLALTDSLRFQTLQEIELIFVDAYHEENKARFAAISMLMPYQIKHVPVHPGHRYWMDKGFCFISAAKNTGILHADGQLCVSCDDAEFFPPTLLEHYLNHYQLSGGEVLMHALHKRLRSVQQSQGLLTQPITGDEYVNDHRWAQLVGTGLRHRYGTLLFAGTSFGLEDALRLNGFNERMDGCKGLEDCDFGNRLAMLGRSFQLKQDGFLYILDHPSYSEQPHAGWEPTLDGQTAQMPASVRRPIDNFSAVENYGMYCCATELLDFVANHNPITPQHLAIIQRETLKYRSFDPLSPENKDKLDLWLGTPTFDLRKERAELRASPEWKWSK